jgi:hypothetical protein
MEESKVKSSFWTLMSSSPALIKCGWSIILSVIGHNDDVTCVSISHGSSTCLAFHMHGWLAVLLSNLILCVYVSSLLCPCVFVMLSAVFFMQSTVLFGLEARVF